MERPIHPKIEELERRLASVPDPSPERIDALNELAWELWTTDTERAKALTEEGYQTARQLEYARGIAYATLNRGIMIWNQNVEEALPHLLDALEQFEKCDEKQGQANTHNFMGIMFWGFGDFERGFECASRALALYQEINDPYGEAWTFNTLGGFYYDLKNYGESQKYFERAYEIFKETGNLLGQARALNGIGDCHLFSGKCKRALVYQKRSLRILREIGHRMSESRTLNDIGLAYQQMGNFEEALKYHLRSLEIRQELHYTTGETTTLLDLGNLYRQRKNYEQALEMLQEALQLSEQIKAKPKMVRAQKALAEIYEALGKYDKAIQHLKAYHQVEEEVFHEDTEKKIKNLKTAYQLEASKKEAEIYRLRNVELKEKNEELHRIIKQLNATQAQLIQSGKMAALGALVAGLAHEINNPLGAIKSGSDLIERAAKKLLTSAQNGVDPDTFRAQLNRTLDLLLQNARNNLGATERIIKMVNSLKNFARLDQAEYQMADIHEDLENTLTLLNYEIPQTLKLEKKYGKLPPLYVYSGELNQVFMNLLMNALQATPRDGCITIRTYAQNGHAVIQFSDTGKGIPEEKLEHLFEPHFTTDSQRVKMRTGLFTSYNIIRKHKGQISVNSEVGKGTTFTIRIPINLPSERDKSG